MKMSLIKKVAIGFSISLLILVLEGVTSYRAVIRHTETVRLAEHTNDCIARLEEIRSLMKDMETLSSRYVVTGDEKFLAAFDATADAIKSAIGELGKIEAGAKRQLNSLETLESLVGSRVEWHRSIMAMRRDKGSEGARDVISADAGKTLAGGIERVILEMKAGENEELKEGANKVERAARSAIYIIVAGSTIAVFIVGVWFFIINRDVRERLRADKELRDRGELLQKIIETLPVCVFSIDKNGKIEKCNPACNQIWSEIRCVGIEKYDEYKGWWVSTGKRVESEEWAAARAIAKGETSLNEEIEIEGFNGIRKIILNSAVPFKNDKNEIVGAIAINQDITERKRAELDFIREKEFSEIVINSLPGIFYLFDLRGTLMRWNKNAEKVTGYSPQEISKMSTLDFFAPEDRQSIIEKATEIINKGETSAEINLLAKDGRRIPHHLKGLRIDVEGNTYIIGSGIDISERKWVEAINKQLIHDLGERVKELTTLHRASLTLQDTQKTIPDLLKEIVAILPEGWQFPDITVARIRYDDIEVTTPNFEESRWSQRADFTTAGGRQGVVEVFYLKEMPEETEGPFLKEERTLINSTAQMIKIYLLRRHAENDLRDSRNLLQKVLEAMPVGVWLLDKTGYIKQGNAATHKIWGGVRYVGIEQYDQYKGWRVDTGKRIEAEEWAGACAVIKGETTVNEEIEIESFDGTRKIILNSAVPIRNERQEIVGAIVVNQDITELQKAKAEAEAASRAKSDFLANMSHEIRTPMNSIMGMADLLSETPLNEEQKKYLDIFRRAGENLLSLINDILDLSKVEAGRLELEEADFDLNETIEKVVEMLGLRAQEKGLELSYYISQDVPQYLRGDPNRLRQILVNLIGNSVKFTNAGEVSLKVGREKNEVGIQANDTVTLLFSVRDTGIGIPSDKLETIFESFSQAHSSISRRYGGTGLGLTIAKRLVEMMGGKIWVESRIDEGSTFYFTVKLGISAKPAGHKAQELDMKGMRVLVVDDSATNRYFLRETVSRYGALATDVESGEKAISELKRAGDKGKPYQLLVLDRHMPGMDGFQVVKEIRKDKELAETAIIMLTSDTGKDMMKRGREAGEIEGYIGKPIRRTELLNAIAEAERKIEATKKAARKKEAVQERHKSLNILLADDSEDNRLLIESYLKKTVHTVETAENGDTALKKFKSGRYDLVLMDMQMPVMDGYTATREIRNWERKSGKNPTPIIALTAYALREDAEKSLEAGCTSHISKPVKKADLLEVIDRYATSEGLIVESFKGEAGGNA